MEVGENGHRVQGDILPKEMYVCDLRRKATAFSIST